MNRRWKFPDRSLLLLLGVLALAVWVIWRAVPALLMSAAIMMAMIVDARPPMPRAMKAMCDKDGGTRVYERVADVDGYAILPGEDSPTVEEIAGGKVSNATTWGGCFPCFEELVKNRYAFVETYYVDPTGRQRKNFKDTSYVAKTGLYRYRLVDRADNPELCGAFDRIRERIANLRRFDSSLGEWSEPGLSIFDRQFREFEPVLNGHCVHAEPIDAFSALYAIRHTRQIVGHSTWRGNPSDIERFRAYVGSADGKHAIAESVAYIYRGAPPHNTAILAECGGAFLPPITQILQP